MEWSSTGYQQHWTHSFARSRQGSGKEDHEQTKSCYGKLWNNATDGTQQLTLASLTAQAFYSVHRPDPWKIVARCGIRMILSPSSIRFTLTLMPSHLRNQFNKILPKQTAVKQGYLLSSILFLSMPRQVDEGNDKNGKKGITWTFSVVLENLTLMITSPCFLSVTKTFKTRQV